MGVVGLLRIVRRMALAAILCFLFTMVELRRLEMTGRAVDAGMGCCVKILCIYPWDYRCRYVLCLGASVSMAGKTKLSNPVLAFEIFGIKILVADHTFLIRSGKGRQG